MAYDFHIVRSKSQLQAASSPITMSDVAALIASDPELEWSTKEYVDMTDDTGGVSRYWMIMWRGRSSFWWYRDQILSSNPDDEQRSKLAQMASALNAFLIGDNGEVYDREGVTQNQPSTSFMERVIDWFTYRVSPRRTAAPDPKPLRFGVGDRVRDSWGNLHMVVSIDPKAEGGVGVIRTQRDDGVRQSWAIGAHGLEPFDEG